MLLGGLVLLNVVLMMTGWDQIRRTSQEVADIIEGFVEGRVGSGAWDDFVCVPIRDGELEAARLRCLGLPDEYPEYGRYCSDDGVCAMRATVAELRASQQLDPPGH